MQWDWENLAPVFGMITGVTLVAVGVCFGVWIPWYLLPVAMLLLVVAFTAAQFVWGAVRFAVTAPEVRRRRLRVFQTNFGREAGWYVEREGRRLALLTDPQFEDMFWFSYAVEPLVDDPAERVRILSDPRWWHQTGFHYRNREFGIVAPTAFPAGRVFSEPGRVVMRALYLYIGRPTLWERFWLRYRPGRRPVGEGGFAEGKANPMTDAEWNSCTDPGKMLEFLRTTGRATERRLRLFAVGCCQRVRPWLYTRNSSQAVLVAEQYADQLAGTEQLTEARLLVRNDLELHPGEPEYDASYWACSSLIGEDVGTCACYAVACSTQQLDYKSDDFGDRCQALAADEKSMQAHLLRDIFGNPLRPASPIHPAWLAWQGGTVPKLAASVYEERQLPSGHLDPARLAVLADALEEAGCTDAQLLGHLRSPEPHYRGCFVLDLLLGKS